MAPLAGAGVRTAVVSVAVTALTATRLFVIAI
jgi:hypothetical protein